MNVLQKLQQKIRELCTSNTALLPYAEFLDEMPVPDRLGKLVCILKERMSKKAMNAVYVDAMKVVRSDNDMMVKLVTKMSDDMKPVDFLAVTMQTAQALVDVFGNSSAVFEDLFRCVVEQVDPSDLAGLVSLAKLENSEEYRYMSLLSIAEDVLSGAGDVLVGSVQSLNEKYNKAVTRYLSDRQPLESETDDETEDEEKATLKAELKQAKRDVDMAQKEAEQAKKDADELRRQLADERSAKATPVAVVKTTLVPPAANPVTAVKTTLVPSPAMTAAKARLTAASVLSGSAAVAAPSVAVLPDPAPPAEEAGERANLSFAIIRKSVKVAGRVAVKRPLKVVDADGKPVAKKPRTKKTLEEKARAPKKTPGVRKPRASKPRAEPKAPEGGSLSDEVRKLMEEVRLLREEKEQAAASKAKEEAAPKEKKKKPVARKPVAIESADTQDHGLF